MRINSHILTIVNTLTVEKGFYFCNFHRRVTKLSSHNVNVTEVSLFTRDLFEKTFSHINTQKCSLLIYDEIFCST